MAERRGTSGRGGVATDAPAFNPDDFVVVKPEQRLSRSDAAPSAYRPLVEIALANIGEYIEQTRPVIGEDGQPNGEREPVTFASKAEAQTFHDGLRAAADQMKLPQTRGKSLRIVPEPKLAGDKAGKDDDTYRVQWYVIPLKGGNANQVS